MVASRDAAKRYRILVVEDDLSVGTMVARMLSEFAEVEVATDGLSALAAVARGPRPDLVITDIMMPGVDGLTFSRKLRENRQTASIPIVMLTGKTEAKDVVAGINAGARHYLTKPFRQQELLEKVKRALGVR